MFSSSPGTHYYHDDRPAAEAQICVAIRAGARHLYLGHGGPVSAEDAWKKFCGGQGPLPQVRALALGGPSERLQKLDQRALVVVAQRRLLLEVAGAEVVAAIDDEVRTLAQLEQRLDQVGEDLARLARRSRPCGSAFRSCFDLRAAAPAPSCSCASRVRRRRRPRDSRSRLASRLTGVPAGIGPISMPSSPNSQGSDALPAARAAAAAQSGR